MFTNHLYILHLYSKMLDDFANYYELLEVKTVQQSILRLEADTSSSAPNEFRSIFKTRHGREMFLALTVNGGACTVTDCFYTDRNQGREGAARLRTQLKTRLHRSVYVELACYRDGQGVVRQCCYYDWE